MYTTTKRSLVLFAVLALSLVSAEAMAQSRHSRHHEHDYHGRAGDVVVPSYGFGFGYGPATAAESYLRGRADLVRAYGQANYYNSMAQINWEQAREKNIENRTAQVNQYFALRSFNEEQRLDKISKSRLSKEQLIEISKKDAPRRLDERHWDLTTGGLDWPTALQGTDFAAERARIDELFRARRDATGGLAGSETGEVKQLSAMMDSTLKAHISSVDPADYVAAKRFLKSISHEVRFEISSSERLANR